MTLREADSLEDLLTRTVADYKRSLEITQNQYTAGTAAKSDVITAQAQVLNAQASLIAAGVSRAQSEHAIAVLMGRPPAGLSIPHGHLATGVPSIPVGLPSSLLERRPDVAAAEETMAQANAEIGVAFAGYFPAISLSGLFGYSGDPWLGQLNVPGVTENRDPLQLAAPFPSEHCPRPEVDAIARGGQPVGEGRGLNTGTSFSCPLQPTQKSRLEVAKRCGLKAVGEDPRQQPAWQVGGRSPAQMIAPLQEKLTSIEAVQARDEPAQVRCAFGASNALAIPARLKQRRLVTSRPCLPPCG